MTLKLHFLPVEKRVLSRLENKNYMPYTLNVNQTSSQYWAIRFRFSLSSRRGSSLIEVIIATLLLAMMTVPIMAVTLTGGALTGKTERRLYASTAAARLAETLKAYVVADTTLIAGPNGDWALPGDSSGLNALEAGHHDLSPEIWVPELAGAPYFATVAYDVSVRQTPQGPLPDVSFDIRWNDP